MFHLASKCFAKCGDLAMRDKASAWHKTLVEAPLLQGNSEKLVALYVEAAELLAAAGLCDLSELQRFARCCSSAGLHAAKLPKISPLCQLSPVLFNLAGEAFTLCAEVSAHDEEIFKMAIKCFRRGDNMRAAADLLFKRGRHLAAVRTLFNAKHFDDALQMLDRCQSHLDLPAGHPLHRRNVLHTAASAHALHARNPRNSNQQASYNDFMRLVAMLSDEDQDSILSLHNYKDELVQRCIDRGELARAAQLLSADGKRLEAARLCAGNPNATLEHLILAQELFLAHVLHVSCSNEEKLQCVKEAGQLQERKLAHGDASPADGFKSLDLFLATFSVAKKSRINQLLQDCPSQGVHPLFSIFARHEYYGPVSLESNLTQADEQELVSLVSSIDAINAILVSKDADKESEYLGCELFFGVKRPFGTCCISPARKAIMDSMLLRSAGATTNQESVINNEGDFVIDALHFKTALRGRLIVIRHEFNCMIALHRNKMLIQDKGVAASTVRDCLQHHLVLLWAMVAQRRAQSRQPGAEAFKVENAEIGSLVLIRPSSARVVRPGKDGIASTQRSDPAQQHKGEIALVLELLGRGGKPDSREVGAAAERRRCDQCGRGGQSGKLLKCSRCLLVYYCSVDCQTAAWGEHKIVCAPRRSVVANTQVDKANSIKVQLSGGEEIVVEWRDVGPLFSDRSFGSVMTDLQDSLGDAVENGLDKIPRLEVSFPPYFRGRKDWKDPVLSSVREWVWNSVSTWLNSPMDARSARTLSKLRVLLDSANDQRTFQVLLTKLDQEGRQAPRLAKFDRSRGSPHRFADWLLSHRFLDPRFVNPELAAHHKMLHLHSHRRDAPVDSCRDIIRAIAVSLLDLSRMHPRSVADRVKLRSSTSAILLPDSIARDLDRLQAPMRPDGMGHNTICLALDNLCALLENTSTANRLLSSRMSLALFGVVCAIPLNFVVAHAPDFPTPAAQLRWSLVDVEKVGGVIEKALSCLECDAKCKIRRLDIGGGRLAAPDPLEFFDMMEADHQPLMLLQAYSDRVCLQQGAVSKSNVAAFFEAGSASLQRMASETTRESQSRAADAGEAQPSDWLNPSAEPFFPSHEQALMDAEMFELDELAEERHAVEVLAAFIRCALVVKARQESDQERAQAAAAQQHAAAPATQLVALDKRQRLARYHGHLETTDANGYRAMRHWGAVKFEECYLGTEEYDQTKSRLFEFQRHYENQVAPLLIQADIQIAHIDEMSALGRQDEETELKLFNQKQMLIRGCDYVWYHMLPPLESSLWSDQQAMRLLQDSLLGPSGGLMEVIQMSHVELGRVWSRIRNTPSESMRAGNSEQMHQLGPCQSDPPYHDASSAVHENQPQAWPQGQHCRGGDHQGPNVDPSVVAVGRSIMIELQHSQVNPSANPDEELNQRMLQHTLPQHYDQAHPEQAQQVALQLHLQHLQRDLPLPRQDRSWAQVVNPVAFDEHGHGDDEEDDLGLEENDAAERVSAKRRGGGKVPRHAPKGSAKRRPGGNASAWQARY